MSIQNKKNLSVASQILDKAINYRIGESTYVSRGENPQNPKGFLVGGRPYPPQIKQKTVPLGYGMERYYAEYFRFVAKKLASFVPKERKNALFAFLLGALHRFRAVQSHKLGSKTKNRT